MIKQCLLAAVAAIGLAVAPVARAHEVQPMIVTVPPSGAGSAFRLMIKNTEAVPITLELQPLKVLVGPDGSVERTPEDADIILFPPQTIIPPGAEQAVQVRYVGAPDLTEAKVYAVLVSQLPVDFSTTEGPGGSVTQVKIGFNFLSHIFVTPPGAKEALSFSVGRKGPDGVLSFEASNDGAAAALFRTAIWTLTDASGRKVELEADKLSYGQFGALMPHSKRTLTVRADLVSDLSGDITVAMAPQ